MMTVMTITMKLNLSHTVAHGKGLVSELISSDKYICDIGRHDNHKCNQFIIDKNEIFVPYNY